MKLGHYLTSDKDIGLSQSAIFPLTSMPKEFYFMALWLAIWVARQIIDSFYARITNLVLKPQVNNRDAERSEGVKKEDKKTDDKDKKGEKKEDKDKKDEKKDEKDKKENSKAKGDTKK